MSDTEKKSLDLRKLVFSGIFAAITFVAFTYLSIPIPTPGAGKVTVHVGNAFVVLGSLLLGSLYGGLGGAIGLTIADLIDPMYITSAPITFVIKFLIGLIAGTIAHRAGHINSNKDEKKVLGWTIAASVAALAFNAIFDPLLRYFYKILILGKPAAEVSLAINFVVTLINSVVSVFIAVILYHALRRPLKKMGYIDTD
ncbi:MAG: ECF transporter S component [Lachnospiraceae bacterium]|nr:ECF transporter S component [Lachnospiraceae bacterium]